MKKPKENMAAFMPYNTPTKMMDDNTRRIFHPAALPVATQKRGEPMKMPNSFTGFGGIALAVKMCVDVVVAVGQEDNPANHTLVECATLFVDPENPFATVEILRTPQTSIAMQLYNFFDSFMYDRALVFWPYQSFDTAEIEKMFMAGDEAGFAFTHPNLNVIRDKIPECIVVGAKDPQSENEITCVNAMSVGTVDDLLKGSFTRVVSIVEIEREPFMSWMASSKSPEIADFLSEYMKGMRGVMLNPQKSGFII